MKKITALVLGMLLLLSCTACDKNKQPNDTTPSNDSAAIGSNQNGGPKDEADKPAVGIALADVMNHPESPADDFSWNDDGNGGVILMKYLGDDEIVVIPEKVDGKSVSRIYKYAFANGTTVKGVKLSSTIKDIDGFAFINHKSLQYVVLGAGVEFIGESAFQSCVALEEVLVSNGIKVIETMAFAHCTSLKSITLPGSLETIEVYAFGGASEGFKIIGKAGSVAETYATEASIPFEAK